VQFTVDGWVMGDAIPVSSEGTAVMALYLDDGPHLVEATYSGSSLFSSSSGAAVAAVGQAPTSLLVATPARIGLGHLYQLSATLSSAGAPLSGAAVWFSAVGSALCVATTNAAGFATCSIDEGTTDLFSLAITGDTASFGGDPTHLPAVGYSPTPNEEDNTTGRFNATGTGGGQKDNVTSPKDGASRHLPGGSRSFGSFGKHFGSATTHNLGSNNTTTSSNVIPPKSLPVSPASAYASDTPATLVRNTSVINSRSGDGSGLFVLVGLLGLTLIAAATLGRRRIVRANLRADRPGARRD